MGEALMEKPPVGEVTIGETPKWQPEVTVLMPVFNGAKHLREALESILNQTFTGFEYLIIDDGSADGSIDIVKSYNDPRIRLLCNEKNLKLAATLNRGLKEARGRYIARMDCDDICLPERLARQVEFMESNPECGLCGTNALGMDISGAKTYSPFWGDTKVPIEWSLLWENPIAHPTVMIRKRVLQDFGLRYRNIPSEDYDLWCRMLLRAKIARLPDVLLRYRFHPDSAFNASKKEHLQQAIESSRELARAITGQSVPEFHRELTIYPGAMGEPPGCYEREAVIAWLETLLEKSWQIFGWTAEDYRYAREDCRRLLTRIIHRN